MAVAFDAKATTVTAQVAYSSPVTNTTLTIGGIGTCIIGVFMGSDTTSLPVPTAMTWNGITMSLLGNKNQADNKSNIYVYGLASPATGAQTLSCTYTSGSGTGPTVYLDCYSFSGTSLTTSSCFPSGDVLTDASTTTGTVYPNSAFSVTTINGDAAVAAMCCFSKNFAGVTSGTLLRNFSPDQGTFSSGFNLSVGAATTMQFTGGLASSIAAGVAVHVSQPSLILNPQQLIMI